MIGITCKGIARFPFFDVLLGDTTRYVGRFSSMDGLSAVAGWGMKRTGLHALYLGRRTGLPVLLLEDGFLRSHGTGDRFPPLSLVVEHHGVYYDSTRPSSLERMLNSPKNLLDGIADEVDQARQLILAHRLSKYNHAPMLEDIPELALRLAASSVGDGVIRRVLVVDQTFGDCSISLGSANDASFAVMLAAARAEHPEAQIIVKTHPEVSSGRKRGYLSDVGEDDRTLVVREAVNPLSLIEQVDKVYVVTSTMGFEALLAGKPVTVFGMPWYAGWGVTDDRQRCSRRSRSRSVLELFAAGYFHYSRYLNPFTHQQGTIFDVIEWLRWQRLKQDSWPHRWVAVGMQRWKRVQLQPMLAMARGGVKVGDGAVDDKTALEEGDALIHWGRDAPQGLVALAERAGKALYHMEDGFYRSVGLGSDLIPPRSLVLDDMGLYFDPRSPSRLEQLLNERDFDAATLERARQVREMIVAHGLTKYNIEPRDPPQWAKGGRTVVLVPGQVEDDASIRHGCEDVRTNMGLLQAVRAAEPDAYIVYKPHPDVVSGNRKGRVPDDLALRLADHVEVGASIVACVEAADAVYTMTSMAGFEALMRDRRVVVYGRPFYSGWGLTEDVLPIPRRTRRLSLDELIAGALLEYPFYWDPGLRGFTTCEAVLHHLIEERDALADSGQLETLRTGYIPRLLRKASAWWGALKGGRELF